MFSVFAIQAQTATARGPQSVGGHTEALDLFCSLFDGSSICIAQLDIWLSPVDGNAAFARAFGVEPEALPGRKILDMVHSSSREKLSRQFLSLAQGERARFAERVVDASGNEVFSAELTGIAVAGEAGQAESILAVLEPERAGGASGQDDDAADEDGRPRAGGSGLRHVHGAAGLASLPEPRRRRIPRQHVDEEPQGRESVGPRLQGVLRRTLQHRHLAASSDLGIHRVTARVPLREKWGETGGRGEADTQAEAEERK